MFWVKMALNNREMAQPKTLLTFILWVFLSNIGRDTDYYKIFDLFISPSRQMPGLYPELVHDRFFSHSLYFFIHYHPIVRRRLL
jgi:hypothetical protein